MTLHNLRCRRSLCPINQSVNALEVADFCVSLCQVSLVNVQRGLWDDIERGVKVNRSTQNMHFLAESLSRMERVIRKYKKNNNLAVEHWIFANYVGYPSL